METETIIAIGLAVVVVGGVIYFISKKEKTASNGDNSSSDPTKALATLDWVSIKNKAEIVDNLEFENVVKWFKIYSMKKGVDIPFVLTKFPETAEKEGYSLMLLGILDTTNDCIKERALIYYKEADEKTKDMLAHSENGIVVLG